MPTMTIEELVEFFLGLLVMAGDYALAIQPRIAGPAQKDGHNAWVSALTDADLSVQNFMEVATLARFPSVGFYGEEHAQSLNQKYFPRDGDISVHLDPVNMICSPQRYFNNAAFLRECFAKLGPYIKSCHAKDILLRDTLTVHLDEMRPGERVA